MIFYFELVIVRYKFPNPTNTKKITYLFPFSFFVARKPFRSTNGRFLSGIGLLAGLTFATLSSSQRLMGLEKNDGEVKSHGALSPEQIAALLAKSNTTVPNIGLIDSSAKRD